MQSEFEETWALREDRLVALVRTEAASFPALFRLRAFGTRTFAIDARESFHDGETVHLVIDLVQPDGSRSSWTRDTPEAIRREMLTCD